MIKYIFLYVLIILIFYILNKNLKKKENFLTYFNPFYDDKINLINNFYKNNDNNKNYLKKKFNYDKIIFTYNSKNKETILNLVSRFIANQNIYNINIVNKKNIIKDIDNVIEYKNYFTTINNTELDFYINNLKKNVSKISIVNKIYTNYIYLFTKNKYQISSINEIFNVNIGIILNDTGYYSYQIFFSNIGLKENKDYKIKLYNNLEDLFQGFLKEECQIIFIIDSFPNENIKNFLDTNVIEDIILLDNNIFKKNIFLQKTSFEEDFIDLNKLSKTYLPKKINKKIYTIYKPNFQIFTLDSVVITNHNTSPELVLMFLNNYDKYYLILNNSLNNYELKRISILKNKKYLEYHYAAIDFFKNKGYITNIDNEFCKYYVDVKKCELIK